MAHLNLLRACAVLDVRHPMGRLVSDCVASETNCAAGLAAFNAKREPAEAQARQPRVRHHIASGGEQSRDGLPAGDSSSNSSNKRQR